MFSISAKVLLPLCALLFLFFSCSRESVEPPWEPQSHLNSKYYNGGLFPVWIKLKDPIPVEDSSSISWQTPYSRIAYRKQTIDTTKNLITADTAFLYWETPPPPFIEIDSVQDGESWITDTTYYYRDTVFAIVNGQESLPIVIEIKNILPRISKFVVGGLEQPGDSLLTIAAHPGDRMEISLYLERTFKSSFYPKVTMPRERMKGDLRVKSETDSLFVYEWDVPNEIIADTVELRIEDSGGNYGYGERIYRVRLVVYTEFGSVWVASEDEIVKFSPDGAEVARIKGDFKSISDIAVIHRKEESGGKLYVTDQQGNSFFIYDTYGKKLYQDNDLFKTPTGVAVDAELPGYIWITDAKYDASPVFEFEAQLRRFQFEEDELRYKDISYEMPSPLKGLAVNQFQKNCVWFALPRGNKVGFVRGSALETEPKYMPNTWIRPSMVSHDPTSGITWVADSARVIAIDTMGNVMAHIKDFSFVSSISANRGNVWVSDIYAGKVYHFQGPFSGSSYDNGLTVMNGSGDAIRFISPIHVSALISDENGGDGGAWVIDKEAGMAVRLDSQGNKIASGTGLKLPNIGKTLQKAE